MRNDCDLIFTTNGRTPFSGYSKAKRQLDAAILAKLRQEIGKAKRNIGEPNPPPWRLHDLRRTAKTLMTRGGVRPDISERVLGHVLTGVEGVYDRHDYVAEKRDALQTLAATIGRIVDPPSDAASSAVQPRKKVRAARHAPSGRGASG